MELNGWLLLVVIGMLMTLMVYPTPSKRTRIMALRLARLEEKVDLILKHLGIPLETLRGDMPERVKELARQPYKKIAAIKVYRKETGASLAEAKEAVEAWIEQNARPKD